MSPSLRGHYPVVMTARNLLLPGIVAAAGLALLLWWWSGDGAAAPPAIAGGETAEAATEPVDRSPGLERADVSRGATFVLRGRVRGRKGVSLDGARVRVWRGSATDRRAVMASAMAAWIDRDRQGDLVLPTRGRVLGEVAVDADGSFAVRGLGERHVRVTLDHDYYALPDPVPVHVALESSEHDVGVLEPFLGGRVVGRVRGASLPKGGEVLLVAEMRLTDWLVRPELLIALGLRSGRRVTTLDDADEFEFRAVWPSPQARVALRDGVGFAADGPFEIVAGETREVELEFVEGEVLTVLVRESETNEPIVGARVRARAVADDGVFGRAALTVSGTTGASGQCVLRGLAPAPHDVSVSAVGYFGESVETEVPLPGGDVIEFALETGGIIEGIVVDANGDPIEDAGVTWHESMSVPIIGDVGAFLGEELMSVPAMMSEYRSGPDGRFRLAGIPPGTETVTLAAEHAEWTGGLTLSVPVGSRQARITLRAPARILGRVVDADTREPLPDFAVETRVPLALFVDRPSRGIAVADSEDGAFEIPRVSPGRMVLHVVAPGYAPLEKRVRAKAGADVDVGVLELGRGVTVRGFVRDTDGNPVVDAKVRRKVRGVGDNALFAALLSGPAERTDEEGRFELACESPGAFSLIAHAEGFARGESERIRAKVGDVIEDVEVRLDSGGRVEGRLLLPDGDTGSHWAVIPENHAYGASRLVTPDEDGSFVIESLDPGRYNVSALDLDGAPALVDRFADGRDLAGVVRDMVGKVTLQICTVRAGETSEVILDVRRRGSGGNTVVGRVTLGGRPLDEGWVEMRQLDGARGALPMGLVDNGRFRVGGVRAGRYTLQIRRGILMAQVGRPQTVEIRAGQRNELKIDLPGGRIRGRVVHDATGEPLPGAVVKVLSDSRPGGADPVDFGFEVTDKQGAFTFVGLTEGVYTVLADEHMSPSGGSRSGGRLGDLRLGADEELAGLVLRARPAAGISVSVANASGEAIARAIVVAVDRDGKSIGTLPLGFTNEKGEAHLAGLPPGDTRIVARLDGYAPGFSDVAYASSGNDAKCAVVLRRGARVVVEVFDENGKRCPDAAVSVRPKDGPWISAGLLSAKPSADGGIDLGPLEPGECEFSVVHARAGAFTVRRSVPDGGPARIELRRE